MISEDRYNEGEVVDHKTREKAGTLAVSETHSSRRNSEKRILRDWDHWVDVLYCKRVRTFLVSTGLKPESHTGE